MAKKRDPHIWTTRIIVGGCLLSFCMCCLAFLMPWRYTSVMETSVFKGFHSVDKNFYLTGTTDALAQKNPWSRVKSDMCQKYSQLQKAQNTAGTATLNMVGKIADQGGGLVGCAAWPLCINHAGMRCAQYKIVSPVVMFSSGMIGSGAFLSLGTIALYMSQGKEKKHLSKKARTKVDDHKKWVAICAIISWIGQAGGTVMWVITTTTMFEKFMAKTVYPIGRLYVGVFTMALSQCIAYNTCCWTCWNYWPQIFPCYKKPNPSGGKGGDDDLDEDLMGDMSPR